MYVRMYVKAIITKYGQRQSVYLRQVLFQKFK
jgi:hypothetical protein